MLWLYLALGTSIAWGAGYALSEKFLHLGVSTPFFLGCLTIISAPLYFILASGNGQISKSLEILGKDKASLLSFGFCILAYVIGNLCITYAIQLKNATYANLIEITYPLFTVLFSYIIYKNFHLNWTTAIGGLLILSGTLLILFKGQS
ncbi:MAG: DMT family transporter [Micavibrio sp.]|nr:DMT family transporter [Micavibrio sp.]